MYRLPKRTKRFLRNFALRFSHKNIQRSSITHPHLLENTVSIIDSSLAGPISVGARSVLNQASIGAVAPGKVSIGSNTSIIGPDASIHVRLNPVIIGNFCCIAHHISIQEYNHIIERCTTYYLFKHIFDENSSKDISSKGPIIVGHDVWLGAYSSILSGVNVGTGAIVGAHSVVTSDVPPYAIVAGAPARVIRYRFKEDLIKLLLELQWWFWSLDRIIKNRNLFEGKLTIEKIKDAI